MSGLTDIIQSEDSQSFLSKVKQYMPTSETIVGATILGLMGICAVDPETLHSVKQTLSHLPLYGTLGAFGVWVAGNRFIEKMKDNINYEISDVIDVGVVGVAGAKTFYAMQNVIQNDVSFFDTLFSRSGFSVYGGVMTAFPFFLYQIMKKNKKDPHLEETTSSFLSVLPTFEMFGRLGCWFSECCFGEANDSFLSDLGSPQGHYPTQLGSAATLELNHMCYNIHLNILIQNNKVD